jgi:hypothetical protein
MVRIHKARPEEWMRPEHVSTSHLRWRARSRLRLLARLPDRLSRRLGGADGAGQSLAESVLIIAMPVLKPGRKRRRPPHTNLTFWLWVTVGSLLALVIVGILIR